MIWMGVGRPEDFVATLNRFPVHNQRVMKTLKTGIPTGPVPIRPQIGFHETR